MMPVKDYDWKKLKFDTSLLLKKHFSKRSSFKKTGVTVHHPTLLGDGNYGAAKKCYNGWQTRKASAHYVVDGNTVAQLVWDRNYAWATGSTKGNETTISIETANSSLAPKWEVGNLSFKTSARLAGTILWVYKLGSPVSGKNLFKHSSWKATACPGPYMNKKWASYVALAQQAYDELNGKKPTPPKNKKLVLDFRHASMQFSDSAKQQKEDVVKLAALESPDILTGTEAGPGAGSLSDELKKQLGEAGYHTYIAPKGTDAWIAVRKRIAKRIINTTFEKIIPRSSQQPGANSRWGDKGLVRVSLELKDGKILVIYALHGLVWSRTENMSINRGATFSYQKLNRKMVKQLEHRMKLDHKAGYYSLFAGDFNQLFDPKKTRSTVNNALFDTGLTSVWNALGKYPSTGHGNIDAIGFLKADDRIKVKSARVWNDKQFFLHTDHFLIGAKIELS